MLHHYHHHQCKPLICYVRVSCTFQRGAGGGGGGVGGGGGGGGGGSVVHAFA